MTYSLCLAHLSDLHFGENSRFKSKKPEDLGKECGQAITTATFKSFGKQRPDIVVVTGDITQQAGEAEFGLALQFFRFLRASLGIPPSAFVFLPGNHDVSWQACQDYFTANPNKRASLYDPTLEQKKFERFNSFKVNFYGKENRPAIIPFERGAALYHFSNKGLCIAALNSCEQETEKRPGGAISPDQARKVMDHLLQDYQSHIKILVLHHPVNSTSDKAAAWVTFLKGKCETDEMTRELFESFCNDALSVEGNEFVTAIMEDCRVHLVLHGHQHSYDNSHQHQWRNQDERCQICPAGSFGLRPDKVPKDQPNCLRLHHLFEKNARLQLNTVSLEYDPLDRLEGVVTKGCFRDTGRKPFEASFPLPPRLGLRTASTDGSNPCAETADNALIDSIQNQVEAILKTTPELSKALGNCLNEIEEPQPLAKALIGKGLERVWGEVTVHRRILINHFDHLKRVLFLLAQCAIKSEAITHVRDQMKLHEEVNIFQLQIRYAMMAELILKAAIQAEINVIRTNPQDRHYVLPAHMIPLPETGIDATKAREYLEEKLCQKLIPELRGLEKNERLERLKGVLRAYFISRQPFFFVHSFRQNMAFPYLVEFLVPHENEPVPPDSVTSINEDTLCTLIKIILTTTSEI